MPLPSVGIPDLAEGLSPASVRAACAAIGISPEPARALEACAAVIAASPRLTSIALRCAGLVFDSDLPPKEAVARWGDAGHGPVLPALFDAVTLLSGWSRLAAGHRRRGIPADVTAGTLRDLELWMEHFRAAHGRWGFAEAAWLARHLTCRVIQLGRLQYEPHPLELPFAVFRGRAEGGIAILVEGGRELRADGQFADADGRADGGAAGDAAGPAGRPAWRSRFVEDADGWRGSPVGPSGTVERTTRILARSDWTRVAIRGDPALSVHIPASGAFNGPLTPEACAGSLGQAVPFFARHFPEIAPPLLACASWMLDPQLARFLPADSNLVRFQGQFHLVPVPGADARQTFERVFGGPVSDWSAVPRDTSLRRVVADQAAAGLHWRMGGGIAVPDDAEAGATGPGTAGR